MRELTLFLLISCCLPGTGISQAVSFQRPLDVGNGLQIQNYVPPNGLAVGDFNGDGNADLVVVNSPAGFRTAPLTVSLGNGDGTFQPAKVVAGLTTLTGRPVVGDFNGDGFLDIAFVETFNSGTTPSSISTRSTIDVLLGKGDGTFRPALVTPFPQYTGPVFGTNVATPLVAADLNRDGHLDLISLATIFMGNGDGTFTPFPTFLDGDAILSSDFNHDGIPDLLIIQPNENAAVILGAGNGTFGADIAIQVKFSPGSFAAGDFNGDGIVDLAVSPTLTGECAMPVSFSCVPPIASIALLIGAGDGTFRPPMTTANAMGPIFGTGDINGDGKLDLIVGNSVLAGVGDGTFRFPVSFGLSTTPCTLKTLLECELLGYEAAVVADFNGDGKQDVAIAYGTYEASLLGGLTVLVNDSPGEGFLVTGVSSASGAWPVDTNSMVTAYGNNLAPMTTSAPNAATPPTTLGGIRVHLWDRITNADQLAPLFFVSPWQINFLLTAADNIAFIGIEHVGVPFTMGGIAVPVQLFQPSLFAVNEAGLAAATAVRVAADGSQTVVPVVSCTGSICSDVPIDVSTGQVYLSIYGTGYNTSGPLITTYCNLLAPYLQPDTYIGPQKVIPGLSQINIPLDSRLAGYGDVAISCYGSNSVHITIR